MATQSLESLMLKDTESSINVARVHLKNGNYETANEDVLRALNFALMLEYYYTQEGMPIRLAPAKISGLYLEARKLQQEIQAALYPASEA
jgi:hypothetical protein